MHWWCKMVPTAFKLWRCVCTNSSIITPAADHSKHFWRHRSLVQALVIWKGYSGQIHQSFLADKLGNEHFIELWMQRMVLQLQQVTT